MNYYLIALIILYLLGTFMTYIWWLEVKSATDKNWQGLLTILLWPGTAFLGMCFVFAEWLES